MGELVALVGLVMIVAGVSGMWGVWVALMVGGAILVGVGAVTHRNGLQQPEEATE